MNITYDTGALLAAERNDRAMWARHLAALQRGCLITVPAPVLAQAWRGREQARLGHLLAGCHVEPLTSEQARRVGALAASTRMHDVVDLAVAEGAIRRGDVVWTSDPQDIERAGVPERLIQQVS